MLIRASASELHYVDLGSSFGSLINGEKRSLATLSVGDVIKLGSATTITVVPLDHPEKKQEKEDKCLIQ